ncbi:MAG TPA: leucyl aminopeptidase [Gemmatimonadales bacterium]|nr:leucyl aminopeptidase [Gemmatimonadales bacterium]
MPFQTQVVPSAPEAHRTPLLIVIVPEAARPDSLRPLDSQSGGALERCYGAGDFAGKKDETALLYPEGDRPRLLLVGIGKPDDLRSAIRRAAAVGAKRARTLGVPEAALFVTPEAGGSLSGREIGQLTAEGAAKGAWHFPDFKQPPEEKKPSLERLDLLASADVVAFREGHQIGAAIAEGQVFCRRLQILPGNHLPPRKLAEAAAELAHRFGHGITVLDREGIEREGMGALLAVAQGSSEEPRFIAIEYAGAGGPPVVLVGKGVSFDTGGVSIKPAQGMEDMKYDMSGAAAVLGAFEMLGRLRPKLSVVGLIPSAENMVSAAAMRPGDVVKSHLGKTIEIVNTDAEGRLLLADALSYARRYSPACVVDIATLTGAISVALGHTAAGLMGNNETLTRELIEAGRRADERVWELPLWDEYKELNKSEIADVKNTGGRAAGSITAGWFLREFVSGFPWAHVDIAGTAYTDREDAASAKGPTGMGVRLFCEFLLARS